MRVSLIITTYNWPESLFLVLKSIENQTIVPEEVVIADDGSTVETKEVVFKFQQDSELNIVHSWQEDKGFRVAKSRNKAMEMVKNIIAKPEMGKIYKGKVVKIMEFGAFVNFLGKQDGLVHISQLAGKRVNKVSDVVKEGDEVAVKVIGFDRGKVKLSIKEAG